MTRDQIINTENPLPRLYLSSDTNELYFYNQEWHSIGGGNASTADYAINAATANYAKDALYAQAASYSTDSGTSNYANSATNASTAYYAQNAGWADFAATANIASSALSSDNAAYANYADAATNAATADYSHNSGTSDRAINADYANWSTYSQDAIDTISRNATTFTVTRKDGSTFIFDQTDESVRQVEVNNSGNYELLLSSVRAGDNGTGETKKNHGVYLTPRDNLNGNRILWVKTTHDEDYEPEICVWNGLEGDEYGDTEGYTMTVYSTDIIVEGTHNVPNNNTWDGTNNSLKQSLNTMHLYGFLTPSHEMGRPGSVYYKLAAENATTVVKEIYYKLDTMWAKYQPDEPTPPVGDELIYDWDFRESMIDKVEGRENVPGAGISSYTYESENTKRSDDVGLYLENPGQSYGPMCEIPVDLRLPGYKVEIEFGDYEMTGSDYYPAIIGSYSDDSQWGEGVIDEEQCKFIYYDDLIIDCYPSAAQSKLGTETVVMEQDDSYFSNCKVTIKTCLETREIDERILDPLDYAYTDAYFGASHNHNVYWEIYKDDVLVGTTPTVYTGSYFSYIGDHAGPNSAKMPAMAYWTDNPDTFFHNILFGIPANCSSVIEIKTLKIYRVNE